MFADLQKQAQRMLVENASAILTGVGAAGTIGTAVLTGRASFKAAASIKEAEETHEMEGRFDKALHVWPLFVPPVGLGAVTVTSIVMANRISAKRAAALAAAYGLSERSLQEYKEKTLEKIGIKKEEDIRAAVGQDKVDQNYSSNITILGEGDVLFMDMLTGRFFMSSVQKVSEAMAKVHSELYNHMYCSFSYFCQEVGLEPTEWTELMGWTTDSIPEVRYDTNVTPDNRPCMTLTFSVSPKPDFQALYD